MEPLLTVAVFCWLPTATLASFILAPLHRFAESQEKSGVRAFSNRESYVLEDGSEIALNWRLQADPDTILSLDTERAAGVQLSACRADLLVLKLPASHVKRADKWLHIVGSAELHNCEHLAEHPLYHRIVKIEEVKPHRLEDGSATVAFSTQELYSPSQFLPSLDWDYQAVPIESLEPEEQEARREALAVQRAMQARRLTFSSNVADLHLKNNFTPIKGEGFKDIFNFTPVSHANFGWNWDFDANTTKSPQFKFVLPGSQGLLIFKDPFIRVNAGMTVKFSSRMDVKNLGHAPYTNLSLTLEGNAYLNADMALVMHVEENVEDPLGRFHLPLLGNFSKERHFFKPLKFSLGGIPFVITPGVSVSLNAYHLGRLKGSLRIGVNTHLRVKGTVEWDSTVGLQLHFTAEALNLKLLPPSWLLNTKHLEFGGILTPSFWMKGTLGPVKDVELAASLRPYMNVSIIEEGGNAHGVPNALSQDFVVFPFRAAGLQPGSVWAVRITANGHRVQTAAQMAQGAVIEFNDKINGFQFGQMSQDQVLSKPVMVELLQDGHIPVGGKQTCFCEGVEDGECQPSPATAVFSVAGSIITVHLTMAWQSDASAYFMGKTRSIGLVFPRIGLEGDLLQSTSEAPPAGVEFSIIRNGQRYTAKMTMMKPKQGGIYFTSNSVQELGVSWVDAWKVPVAMADDPDLLHESQPMLELIYIDQGGVKTVKARGQMPSLPWDTDLAGGKIPATASCCSGTPFAKSWIGNVPLDIKLVDAQRVGEVVARGKIGYDVQASSRPAYFIQPKRFEEWVTGSTQKLYWTTGTSSESPLDFAFAVSRLQDDGSFADQLLLKKLRQAKCEVDSGTESSPCVFQETLHVEDRLSGMLLNFQLYWVADDFIHMVTSAPVSVVTSQEFGRLYEEVSLGTGASPWNHHGTSASISHYSYEDDDGDDHRGLHVGENRRLDVGYRPSNFSFGRKMAELQPHCTSKPLHYKLGMGVFFRAEVHNLVIPFQGTYIPIPEVDTDDIPLRSKAITKAIHKILPKGFCEGGGCAGTLPGCAAALGPAAPPMTIPKVEFDLNRKVDMTTEHTKDIRKAIAYAMCLVPEALQILKVYLKEVIPEDFAHSTCHFVPNDDCVKTFRYRGHDYTGCTRVNHWGGGAWCSKDEIYNGSYALCKSVCHVNQRRLKDEADQFDRIVLSFSPDALHYRVDHDLLSTLVSRGSFGTFSDGREHELGEARIVGFKIQYDDVDRLAPNNVMQHGLLGSVVAWAVGALTGAMALLVLALFLYRRLLWRYSNSQMKYQNVDGQQDGETSA